MMFVLTSLPTSRSSLLECCSAKKARQGWYFSPQIPLCLANMVFLSDASAESEAPESAVSNLLRLFFQGGPPGQYPCTVTLRSAYDIRILSIECTSLSQGSKAELEFQTAAGQAIKQEIPIVNNTCVSTLPVS
jgi:hypothetical protein